MTTQRDLRKELVEASLGLLADHGPDALQARRVAAACDTSTMSVYTYFGGMKQLLRAVADEGFHRFAKEVELVEQTDDTVADMMVYALVFRRFALENPHLYRLISGMTSAHGVDVPVQFTVDTITDVMDRPEGRMITTFVAAIQRAIDAGRLKGDNPLAMVLQFWSAMHGYVLLELAGYLGGGDTGLTTVLIPLGTTVMLGWGDQFERIWPSQQRGLEIMAKLPHAGQQ
jgi:AcrR family transcriptional regulator